MADEEQQPTADSWARVGEGIAGLGRRLQEHYQQRRSEEAAGDAQVIDAAGDAGVSPGARVDDALERLVQAVDAAVDAIGSAVVDPDVREHARRTATTLAEALTASVLRARDQLGGRFGSAGDVGAADVGSASPGTSEAVWDMGGPGPDDVWDLMDDDDSDGPEPAPI